MQGHSIVCRKYATEVISQRDALTGDHTEYGVQQHRL